MILFILLLALACMVLPYGVKNPPRRFPLITIILIGLNVLVHCLACDFRNPLYMIRMDVVDKYALVWGGSPVYTIFTSMFLHGDVFHLAGNMLYLWVFGRAVEDRLGAPMYIFAYLLAGAAGDVAQVALDASGVLGMSVPIIGASGAIFGILGAYWYLYPWSQVSVFYSFLWVFRGVWEKKAFWVIGIYFVVNLITGVRGRLDGQLGGVANFAHVGGCLAGVVLVWALQIRRDSSAISDAKAVQAEVRDISLLSCADLCKLVEANPGDEQLFVDYARKTIQDGSRTNVEHAITMNPRAVMIGCPEVALYYLINLTGNHQLFCAGDLIYLGKLAEAGNNLGGALGAYGMVEQFHPDSRELEMALYRTAALLWHKVRDGNRAVGKLEELLSRFPNGALMFDAQDLRDLILREGGADSRRRAA